MSWNIAKPGDQINGPVAVTGNLNVDSNTLFVDSVNNRVGVLTASPTVPLDVVGDAKVSGNLIVDTNTLVVDAANNRLGIGTATPAARIHVADSQLNSYAYLQNDQTLAQFRSIQLVLANGPTAFGANNRDWRVYNVATSATASDFVVDYWTGTAISEKFKIASDGVCTWSNVVNAGTAMTLNGTGLGVGVSPAEKLTVGGRGYFYTANPDIAGLRVQATTGTNAAAIQLQNSGGNYYIGADNSAGSRLAGVAYGLTLLTESAQPIVFGTNNAFRAIIDSSGNVGIGTTNPIIVAGTVVGISRDQNSATLLTVSNQANNASSSAGIDIESFGGGWRIAVPHSATYTNPLLFSMGGNERMRLTSSGNLGLAVTPAAWSGFKALQIARGSLTSFGADTFLSHNWYWSGTADTYIANDYATRYYQSQGKHIWDNGGTSAGTAGATISFTQAMTLDASGNLGIGTSTIDFRLDVRGAGAVYSSVTNTTSGSGSTRLRLFNTGDAGDGFAIINNAGASGQVNLLNYKASTLAFWTDSTQRLSIKSTGQVNFVGLASDPAGAAAGDVYYNTTTNKLKCYNGTTWNDLF